MGLFDIRKGVVGNIENALLEILHANNNLAFEQRDRQTADTENREAVEQAIQGKDCTFSAFVIAAVRAALEDLNQENA